MCIPCVVAGGYWQSLVTERYTLKTLQPTCFKLCNFYTHWLHWRTVYHIGAQCYLTYYHYSLKNKSDDVTAIIVWIFLICKCEIESNCSSDLQKHDFKANWNMWKGQMSVSALLAFVSFWEHMSLFVYNKNQSVEISQICLPFCKELCSCTLWMCMKWNLIK